MPARRKTLAVARSDPSSLADLSGRKVLVVDDDPATVHAVRQALAPYGYELFEARDGLAGHAVRRSRSPGACFGESRHRALRRRR